MTIDYSSSLFATIRHYSPLFALFKTIRTIRDYSLFAIRDYIHYSGFLDTPVQMCAWLQTTLSFLSCRLGGRERLFLLLNRTAGFQLKYFHKLEPDFKTDFFFLWTCLLYFFKLLFRFVRWRSLFLYSSH